MNVEERTDPMTRAVPVIKTVLPERTARQHVKIIPGRAVRKDGDIKRNVALQDAREAAPLEIRRRTKMNGSCDVSCSFPMMK